MLLSDGISAGCRVLPIKQKSPQAKPAVHIRQTRTHSAPPVAESALRRAICPMTVTDLCGLHPSAGASAPLLPFGAAPLPAVSQEACPPPRYAARRTSDPIVFLFISDTMVILSRFPHSVNVNAMKRQSALRLYFRRLPATSRMTPPRNFGTRIHTMRTLIMLPSPLRFTPYHLPAVRRQ